MVAYTTWTACTYLRTLSFVCALSELAPRLHLTHYAKDVKRFVTNYHTCKRIKPHRHATHGTLLPLPVPDHPWQEITMDFVVAAHL